VVYIESHRIWSYIPVPKSTDFIFPQILKCRKKQEAGVHFFVSHPIFDLAGVEEFFKQASEVKIPLLASVCLLKEEQIREYLPGKYPGLLVPQSVVERFKTLNATEFRSGMIEYTANNAPLSRPIEAYEVANAAAFLCSDLASGITGEILHVDCGMSVMGVAVDSNSLK